MGIQVQELIDKIKNEGVGAANKEAERILAAAEARAAAIVADAEREAAEALRRSEERIARDRSAGKDALAQASRDAVLALGKAMQRALDRIVARELKSAYDDSALKEIIPALAKSWMEKEGEGLELLLPAADLNRLDAFFAEKLKAEIARGSLEFKAGEGLKSGFKVVERSGSAYFDFSSEALAEIISGYLNPILAGIVRDAARGS